MKPKASRVVCASAFVLFWILLAGQRPATAQQPQPPAPPAQPQPSQDQQPGYAISVTVPVVNLDVAVTDDAGNYLPGLSKENFRVLEDGKPQVITNFATGESPITVVVLVEYSRLGYGWYLYNAVNWADVFLHSLKKNDWVALESFAMRTKVEVDFTHDPTEIEQGLSQLMFPIFTESNVFDALVETINRLQDVKGRKAILLLASGHDTLSRATLDKTLAKLKETDASIFCVGVAEQEATWEDMSGGPGTSDITYLQAQNQLHAFAELTGGRVWFPHFNAEIPNIMSDVANNLRNEYNLAYTPNNSNLDGTYRKIKVQLVAPDGGPLTVLDQKGKKRKFVIHARQGYTAPKNSVADSHPAEPQRSTSITARQVHPVS